MIPQKGKIFLIFLLFLCELYAVKHVYNEVQKASVHGLLLWYSESSSLTYVFNIDSICGTLYGFRK